MPEVVNLLALAAYQVINFIAYVEWRCIPLFSMIILWMLQLMDNQVSKIDENEHTDLVTGNR